MTLTNIAIVAFLAYMVGVPCLAMLRRHRWADAIYSALERLGLHQSWTMFTGSELQYTRRVWLRFEDAAGRVTGEVAGLNALPEPHQPYAQRWLADSRACRAAIVDAILDHHPPIDDDAQPAAVAVVQRSRAVQPPPVTPRYRETTVELARIELEADA